MLLTGGMGIVGYRQAAGSEPIGGNIGLLCGGMGTRLAQTAHPYNFNTPIFDPDTDPNYLGADGDPEYPIMTPEVANVYNARAVQIFLPEGTPLPLTALKRLEDLLRLTKPMTISLRVRSTKGPWRLEILDPAEETL